MMINTSNSKLTNQARQLLSQGYGFRTDEESVDDGYKPDEIINYEINELGNTDIPDTLNQLYNTDFKPDKNDIYNITPIDNFIRKQLGLKSHDYYQLIWLASSWHACYELYAPGHITPKTPHDIPECLDAPPSIDKYFIKKSAMLVSDLGYDGQLFAFPDLAPIEAFNY